MPRHLPYMDDHASHHPTHNLNSAEPLRSPTRAEIVRRGRVMATVYVRQGESLDEMQARAQRMAAGYSGKVVMHEA